MITWWCVHLLLFLPFMLLRRTWFPFNKHTLQSPNQSSLNLPSLSLSLTCILIYKRLLTLVNSRSASSVSAAPFKIAAYIKNTDNGSPNAVMTAVMGRPSLGFPPESSNSDPVFSCCVDCVGGGDWFFVGGLFLDYLSGCCIAIYYRTRDRNRQCFIG